MFELRHIHVSVPISLSPCDASVCLDIVTARHFCFNEIGLQIMKELLARGKAFGVSAKDFRHLGTVVFDFRGEVFLYGDTASLTETLNK